MLSPRRRLYLMRKYRPQKKQEPIFFRNNVEIGLVILFGLISLTLVLLIFGGVFR